MRWWWILCGLFLLLYPLTTTAHRSGCHRWHSCPSDRGTYVCGDRGKCSECPDNEFCQGGRPRLRPLEPASKPHSSERRTSEATSQVTFTGKVVGVSDGDTLKVLRHGEAVKVRLHGIDSPEKRQAFGNKAKQFASEHVFGQEVSVKVWDTDRYGRLVGDVSLASWHLNRELVRAGLAWWYQRYAPNEATLKRLEAEARGAKRGFGASQTQRHRGTFANLAELSVTDFWKLSLLISFGYFRLP